MSNNQMETTNNPVGVNGGAELMRKSFITKIKDMLEKQKTEILSRVEKNAKLDEIDEGSNEDTDKIQARILAMAARQLAERDKNNIRRIDAAMERIAKDEFGMCAECGEDIDEKRLIISPTFVHCISCSERIEHNRKKYAR